MEDGGVNEGSVPMSRSQTDSDPGVKLTIVCSHQFNHQLLTEGGNMFPPGAENQAAPPGLVVAVAVKLCDCLHVGLLRITVRCSAASLA